MLSGGANVPSRTSFFKLVVHFDVLQDCSQAPSTGAYLQGLEKSCVVWLARGVPRLFKEDMGSEVVFWFVVYVHGKSPLPIPLRRC